MRLKFLLAALTFFLLLAYSTHSDKREESPKPVVKQDFLYKDFIHGTTITGSWIDQNYIINMETSAIRLELKLAFEFTKNKGSANVDRLPNDNRTPKHGKIHKFNEFFENSRNGTCPDYETVRPRFSGLITYAWYKCCDVTVAMADKVLSGVTLIAEWIWDKAVWLADKVWFIVRFLAYSFWNGITLMAEVIWDIIARVGNSASWTAEWTWEQGIWIADKIWNGITWVEEWICCGLKWTGNLFRLRNFVTDAVLEFYYGHFDTHATYIHARISMATWQDVLYMISAVLVMNLILLGIYLFLKVTLNFIRRLWRARKDRVAAASLPPAPKKPIWRPKQKKKRRKNKNTW